MQGLTAWLLALAAATLVACDRPSDQAKPDPKPTAQAPDEPAASADAAPSPIKLDASGIPTGHDSPEGIACDAVTTFIRGDGAAWEATLVRPIYGPKGDVEYAEFKRSMKEIAERSKTDGQYAHARLVACSKATPLSMNGPHSAAYALYEMTGNSFVDVVIEEQPGELRGMRYHVLQDKDGRWYFEPRPDLCSLLSAGLNDEPDPTEWVYSVEPTGP